jgi:peptide/nickel transport system permease protein
MGRQPPVLRLFSKAVGGACATMLAVSLLVYLTLEFNGADVAAKVLGPFSAPDQRYAWMREHGYLEPLVLRYLRWLANFVAGNWGTSTYYKEDILALVAPRLASSSILAAGALIVIVPFSIVLGVISGVSEGSALDRAVSSAAILATSLPEFASAALLTALLVFWLNWLPGTSTMSTGFSWRELVLPIAVLSLSSAGYIARITRASIIDVMASPFVHTARMKGCSWRRVVLRHALRHALIAPVTLGLLQIPWILSNVVIVEVFFAYKGLGTLLYEASLNSDIRLIEACSMVSVIAVVSTQVLADVIHGRLNPRIAPWADDALRSRA